MATVAHAFSPKEFQVWIAEDNSNAGASGISDSAMHQLDVDSVGFPSLNVNQALDVRNGSGHTFKAEDFFQDNKIRVTELSISGTLHSDDGHKLLAYNISGETSGDAVIGTGHKLVSQKYGASATNSASSLTVVIKSSDHSNQTSLELFGCVVTNLSISADSATEGGRYKFSATLQTGKVPHLAESSTACGNSVYANSTAPLLSNASSFQVKGIDVIMSSFTATIDYPAVFTGQSSTGYEVVSRGAECAGTVDTQVKYDGNTKSLVNDFDTQTAAFAGNPSTPTYMFNITNNNAFGVEVDNGVFTNVAYSEGDIMMLDCSIKSVDDGTDPLITLDITG